MESLINLCHKNNITFYQNNSNVLESYSTVMGYIYINCERDEHGILVTRFESGDCGKWMEQFENLKSQILSNDMDFVNFDNIYVKFTHFETRKILDANNKEKSKLIPIIENANMAYFSSYLTEKIKKFVFHSNANTRDYILWKIFVDDLNFIESPLVTIDFSENLQIPIQKEPQSLYWVRKAISILCGITNVGKYGKTYHGMLSEDRDHDQTYTYEGLMGIISTSPIRSNIVIRSDATHFKCAECFDDLQSLSDDFQATVVRVYGIAGHEKGEIDSVGGHLKNAVRSSIQKGQIIVNADDCSSILKDKFKPDIYVHPAYDIQLIEEDDLESRRNEKNKIDYQTINGIHKFHSLVFQPGKTSLLASNQLCVCRDCLEFKFNLCPKFQEYELKKTFLRKPITHSEITKQEDVTSTITSMVIPGNIFPIKAMNSQDDFFLLECVKGVVFHEKRIPYVDSFGHIFEFGCCYIEGKYLETIPTSKINKFKTYEIKKDIVAVDPNIIFFPSVPNESMVGNIVKFSNDMILELGLRSLL